MTEVTCIDGVPHLMEYLEGVLSDEVRATLERHVAGCPKCTAFVASYLETPRIVREATAITLPADRQDALRTFLRERLRR